MFSYIGHILTSDVTSLHSYWQSVYHYQDVSPNFDDTLGTIAASLARLSAKHLTNSAVQCSVSAGKVYEVTSYLQNDNYKVWILLGNISPNNKTDNIFVEVFAERPNN